MPIRKEYSYNRLEFHVEDISSWDGFEEICRFIVEHLGAELLSMNDGPDARVWRVKKGDETLCVVHDDMVGNFFFSERQAGEPVAEEIANKLIAQIR